MPSPIVVLGLAANSTYLCTGLAVVKDGLATFPYDGCACQSERGPGPAPGWVCPQTSVEVIHHAGPHDVFVIRGVADEPALANHDVTTGFPGR